MLARRNSAIRKATSSPVGGSLLRNEVQAAAFLAVSPRALRKWRVTGRGPQFVRLSSRCIRYSQADLVRWIEDRACRAP
jgi:hypothetical protein